MSVHVLFSATIQADFAPGEVALIGAGPGDPGLLTLRAWALLRQADVLVHDRLVSPEIIDMVPAQCQRIYVGKSCRHHVLTQEQINELLADLAAKGLRVARLKGGDPFVFGRGGEELDYLLKQGVPCQIVPGITAASGCLAYAGIPLTHRGIAQSCRFITGHFQKDAVLDLPWNSLATESQTLVFYMGLGALPVISRELIAAGLSPNTPAALIGQGAGPNQRICRSVLRDLPTCAEHEGFVPPTLIVIGEVVGLFADCEVQYPGQVVAPLCDKEVSWA